MTNARRRDPMADQLLKTHPRKLPFLATPRKRAVPEALDMVDKATQRGVVERHSIIQCCLRSKGTVSALRLDPFRGSIPNLCVLLSTLGPGNCSPRSMTRSQTGWLGLICSGLSPPTYCRFLPALPFQGQDIFCLRGRGRREALAHGY